MPIRKLQLKFVQGGHELMHHPKILDSCTINLKLPDYQPIFGTTELKGSNVTYHLMNGPKRAQKYISLNKFNIQTIPIAQDCSQIEPCSLRFCPRVSSALIFILNVLSGLSRGPKWDNNEHHHLCEKFSNNFRFIHLHKISQVSSDQEDRGWTYWLRCDYTSFWTVSHTA